MTHILVKILVDDDGETVDHPVWHLMETDQGYHALCTGEYVGGGESACEFETKEVFRGVECPKCREILKRHKAIKL